MGENKEKVVICAEAIIDAYNVGNMVEMEKFCRTMDGYMKKNPTYFTRTKHTYIVSVALFYAIRQGFCQGENPIVVTYYSLVKTIRKSLSSHNGIASAMLAFVFLDKHKAIIGLKVIENNLPPSYGTDRNEIIINQIIGQLSAFYWSFTKPNQEQISFDSLTMQLIEDCVSKYRHKFDGIDENSINRVTDFIMENFDVMLQTLEIYWEDLEDDDYMF